MKAAPRALVIVLLSAAALSAACAPPRAPRASSPFAVRLVGASDGALSGSVRDGHGVFAGSSGRDYAIEVTNDTPSNVGFSIVVDGLDAKTGEPVTSCADLGGWVATAEGRMIVRGFSVSDTRIAAYRFAPLERSLAAITKGGRRDPIGTIEVCFFSLRPRSGPVVAGPASFGGVVEREPSDVDTPIVAELRDEPPGGATESDAELGALLTRVVVTYEDAEGRRLGTAPPPDGIAQLARPPRAAPAPVANDDDVSPTSPSEDTKATKPNKRNKPIKPYAGPKPPKGTKGTTKDAPPRAVVDPDK